MDSDRVMVIFILIKFINECSEAVWQYSFNLFSNLGSWFDLN